MHFQLKKISWCIYCTVELLHRAMQYKPKVFWQLSVIHWKYDSHDRLNWSTWISFKLLPNVNRAQTTAVLDLYWSPFSIILPLGSFNNASLKHLHVPLVCGCLFVVSEQDCTKTTLSWISKLHFEEFENYIAQLQNYIYKELQNYIMLNYKTLPDSVEQTLQQLLHHTSAFLCLPRLIIG